MAVTRRIVLWESDWPGGAMQSHSSNCGLTPFVETYWPLLSVFTLLVSDNTARFLRDMSRKIQLTRGVAPDWDLDVSRNSRALAIRVQACEDLDRVLLFLKADRLREELERLWILRDSISDHGQKLHVNCGAWLWAEQDWAARCGNHHPKIGADDAIMFIGGNGHGSLERFAKKHMLTTMRFPRCVLTTRGNKIYVREFLHDSFRRIDNSVEEIRALAERFQRNYQGPVGFRTARKLCHVVACPGRHHEHVHGQVMEEFLESCADPRMNVNLLLNKPTAEEWIGQFEEPRAFSTMVH